MFEKIQKWHKLGLWKEKQVLDAAMRGVLTEEECFEILYRDAQSESIA
jgi:hypothetical protein